MTSLPPLRDLGAVLLDAGETLLLMQPSLLGAYVRVCHEAGIDVDEERLRPGFEIAFRELDDEMRHDPALRSDPDREFARWLRVNQTVFASAGLTAINPIEMSHRMEAAYAEGRLTEPAPGMHDVLRRLRAAGLRLGIVSNAAPGMGDLLAGAGVTALVDHVAISTVVGWEKPSPRLFHHCLDALGVAPARAAHVGDSLLADGEGARRAGLGGFVFLTNGRPVPPTHSGPFIHHLAELPDLLGVP